MNLQFFLPIAIGLMVLTTGLFSIGRCPVPYRGFCLLTRKAPENMVAMLPDIPVILSPAAVHPWASPAVCESADLERLLLPDKVELVAYPVDNDAIGA